MNLGTKTSLPVTKVTKSPKNNKNSRPTPMVGLNVEFKQAFIPFN